MFFDLEAKSIYTFKGIGYYSMNKKLSQNIQNFMQILNLF